MKAKPVQLQQLSLPRSSSAQQRCDSRDGTSRRGQTASRSERGVSSGLGSVSPVSDKDTTVSLSFPSVGCNEWAASVSPMVRHVGLGERMAWMTLNKKWELSRTLQELSLDVSSCRREWRCRNGATGGNVLPGPSGPRSACSHPPTDSRDMPVRPGI